MTDAPDRHAAARVRLFLHSLLAFTIAFLASTLIHEGAHAATARALGRHPVLHHNYVATPDEPPPSPGARLWVPASGPLASLVLGVACLLWVRSRRTATLVSLTMLWLALKAFIGFFGYLMMGPLFAYGDTGRVYAEVGLPGPVSWLLALGGLAALIALVRGATRDFERHVPPAPTGEERSRRQLANAMIAWPIFAGVVVTTLLSLPAPAFLSLLHPMTSPFVLFIAYGRFRRNRDPLPDGAVYPPALSVPLVAVTAVLVGVSRLLVGGLSLG